MPFLSFHSRNLSGRKSCCFCSNWTSKLRARLLSFCSLRFMARWEMVGEEMVLISAWFVEYLEPFLISNRIYINICNFKSKTNLSWLATYLKIVDKPTERNNVVRWFHTVCSWLHHGLTSCTHYSLPLGLVLGRSFWKLVEKHVNRKYI
jgi:hypothetical protein